MTTPDRKTLIGKVLREAKYVINEDDLRDYLPVCEEDHPAFFSEEVAPQLSACKKGGYRFFAIHNLAPTRSIVVES